MKRIILCCGLHGRCLVIASVESDPVPGEPVTMYDARMVLKWSEGCGGLFGFAASGPRGGTKITRSVPRAVETVWQEWIELSDEAAQAIDRWPSC